MSSVALQYVASIDVGTSSVRIILFDFNGNIIKSHSEKLELMSPQSGWVEQDPIEIINLVSICMNAILSNNDDNNSNPNPNTFNPNNTKIDKSSIISVGITNQRETTIIWDSETGQPLYGKMYVIQIQ